jgi:dolichol kinase
MKKISSYPVEFSKKIQTLEFDTHWYRRVFHAFGASFLIYYIFPADTWIQNLKMLIAVLLVAGVGILEVLRIQGKIDSSTFFGLRIYETKRPGSYLYFGLAILILLLAFPQQIAIPCILCACFADPLIGETRQIQGKNKAYLIGFAVCFLFFIVTWYTADIRILVLVSFVGAMGALIGETRKCWWLDDDFLIQMTPAALLLIIWIGARSVGVDILPEPLLHPFVPFW